MQDLSIFDFVRENSHQMTIDEIKNKLITFIYGMTINSPVFHKGTFLYRARLIDENFNKESGIKFKDLIYPPAYLTKLGRVNREGNSMFYCSLDKETVFYEVPYIKSGDELILTFWKTNEKMFVNNIGYTKDTFDKLKSNRICPDWSQPNSPENMENCGGDIPILNEPIQDKQNIQLRNLLSKYFTESVENTETHLYKITTAISELHFGTIINSKVDFAGLIYPSVKANANYDNIALFPDFVDNNLIFKKAMHIKIGDINNIKIDITYLDTASEFNDSGNIIWLGRLKKWSGAQDAICKFEEGEDEDGDYILTSGKDRGHWVMRDKESDQIIIPS